MNGLTIIPSACHGEQEDLILQGRSNKGAQRYSVTNELSQIKKVKIVDQIRTFIALTSKATPPQADGDAIDVPFISMRLCRVHWGTGATAPPGALIETPRSPSAVGPRLDLKTSQNFQLIRNPQYKIKLRDAM